MILADAPAPEPHRGRRHMAIYASVAAVVVALVVLIVTVAVPRPSFAVTPPLLPFGSTTATSSEVLSAMAATLHDSPGPTPVIQAIRVQMWSLNVVDAGDLPTIVVPEEVELMRASDGTRDVTVTAGVAYDGGGRPVEGGGAPRPGTVLRTEHQGAGEYPYQFPDPPPASVPEMRDYLATFAGIPDAASADAYLVAIPQLLMEWQLAPQQESALVGVLAELPDIEVAGTVTDRLGRDGVAITAPAAADHRHTLILSAETGQILSFETLYVGHDRTDIPSPAVIAYYAWERN